MCVCAPGNLQSPGLFMMAEGPSNKRKHTNTHAHHSLMKRTCPALHLTTFSLFLTNQPQERTKKKKKILLHKTAAEERRSPHCDRHSIIRQPLVELSFKEVKYLLAYFFYFFGPPMNIWIDGRQFPERKCAAMSIPSFRNRPDEEKDNSPQERERLWV